MRRCSSTPPASPTTPAVRFAEKTFAPTEYSSSASPFAFTSAASQPTAPDAVATVTAAPSVAPLSVLSRTFSAVPPESTKNSSARDPSAHSATPAFAAASRSVHDPKLLPRAGVRDALVIHPPAARPRPQQRAIARHRRRVVAVRLARRYTAARTPAAVSRRCGRRPSPSGTGRRSGSSAPRAAARAAYACQDGREQAFDLVGADVTVVGVMGGIRSQI